MAIRDDLARLRDLYRVTGDDWVLIVHHILTEPTCPTVIIRREDSNALRYRFDRDSIEEGIQAASEAVYREVVLGQSVEPESPITNPDDHPDDPNWRAQPDIIERLNEALGDESLAGATSLHYAVISEIENLRGQIEDLKIRLSKHKQQRDA